MPGIHATFDAVLATIQSLFTVLRDMLLAALLIGLLAFPAQLNLMLTKAGISQVNGGVFTWQQQAQQAATQSTAAAQANSSASDSLDDVKSVLENIASQSTDPNIKQQATAAATQVASSMSSLDTANNSLANSVLTLQTAPPGAQSSAQHSPTSGWVLLGNSDSTHQQWTKSTTPKISGSPAVAVGQTVTFSADVFLRGDNAQGQAHDQAPIRGAVRSGSAATITAVDYVPNKKGNDRVWIEVNMKSNQ